MQGVILTNLILSILKKFFKFSLLLALPLVAAAAIVWNVAAIPGERTDTVLLPDPEDCSYFFSCSYGVPIRLKCPDGLYFNDLYDVCDWPQNVPWCKDKTKTKSKYTCYSNSKDGDNGETYTRCSDCEESETGRIGYGDKGECERKDIDRD